jgi:hypothetical protein
MRVANPGLLWESTIDSVERGVKHVGTSYLDAPELQRRTMRARKAGRSSAGEPIVRGSYVHQRIRGTTRCLRTSNSGH